MSASLTSPYYDETYERLVDIICPNWSQWPSSSPLLEIAILPSSSHLEIQYDPKSSPPAVGIPKSLGLACFLHARSILHSYVKTISGQSIKRDSSYPVPSPESSHVLKATAVMLIWEPNHLTAINWRKRMLQQLLRCAPASESVGLGQKAHCVELIFLESLLTSPMPQHAKSSMLWAYRLQLLRASEKYSENPDWLDPPPRDLNVEETWSKEVG